LNGADGFAAALARLRIALIVFIPFAVTLNGVPIEVASVKVRIDQAVAILLLLVLAVEGGWKRIVRSFSPSTWAFMVFVCSALASCVFFAPYRGYSLLQFANQASAWGVYGAVVASVGNRRNADILLRFTLIAAVIAVLIGMAALALNLLGARVPGANLTGSEIAETPFGAYGTLYEPNIFGNYCAIAFSVVAILGLRRTGASSTPTFPHLRLLTILLGIGLLFSFTRGAWLGAAAGLVTAFAIAVRFGHVRAPVRAIAVTLLAAAAAVLLLWYVPYQGNEFFRYKVVNLLNPTSSNAGVRLLAIAVALDHVRDYLVFGAGTFSFAPLVAGGLEFRAIEGGTHLWLGNYIVAVLHDYGIVGLALFVVFLAMLIGRALRVASRIRLTDRMGSQTLVALVAGLVCMLIAFVFTSGFSLGYPWLFIGLLDSFTRVCGRRSPRAAPVHRSFHPAVNAND
jgi:hypothetical protein